MKGSMQPLRAVRISVAVALIVGAFGTVGVGNAAAQTLSPMIDLGTLGGVYSVSHAVSGTIVVGESSISGNAEIHGFAYDLSAASPEMIDLGTLGGTYSDATGVSGNIIVGSSMLSGSTLTHAYAYDLSAASPHMVDLGTLGGSSSVARAVSGSLIVGNAQVSGDASFEPFAYDLSAASPQIVGLGTLGGTSSVAAGVSGSIVVGSTTNMTTLLTHAFAYDRSAASPRSIDLGTLPGGIRSGATGVDGSVVVGSATVSDVTNNHAFAYDLAAATPHMTDLGTLGGADAGASAVSGKIVVGSSQISGSPSVHAFAYDLSSPSLLPRITSVSPKPFSPNHDGTADTTSFRVHLPKAEFVSFLIRNSNGQTIRGPHTPGLRGAGDHTWRWDGRTNKARIAADGVYTIVVTTSVKSGGITLHFTATEAVRLDNTPPRLSRITGDGASFYPLCSRCGKTTFRPKVDVNESGRLWLVIAAGAEKVVVAQPHASIGTFQLVWNGRDHEGRLVPQRAYKYYFTALDSASNRRTSATYVVRVSHQRAP